MDRATLGPLSPPVGRISISGYEMLSDGKRFAITATDYPERIAWLDLAVGSGKTGMTYVSVDGGRLSEAEMSYFPPFKSWWRTPGHKPKPTKYLGQLYDEDFSRRCLGCHAVTLPERGLALEKKFYGVGCEACHGPGKAHIAAARAGNRSGIGLGATKATTPAKLNDLCGKCHAPFKTPNGLSPSTEETHRFQPLGITKSACFIKSGGALSCVTCHDPHKDASTDKQSYEVVCLSCHSKPLQPAAPTVSKVFKSKPCPVNAKTDCISCHMPPRRIFRDSDVPTRLADHLIKIYEPKLLDSLQREPEKWREGLDQGK
jgi:hypothetical protein